MALGKEGVRLTLSDMAKHIPTEEGKRFHIGLERGQLTVELYMPKGEDLQQPHTRDECYVVMSGQGRFQMGDQIVPFKEGDFLFVPAGMDHRFLDFGDEVVVWVIFYGPEGGEQ